MVWGSFSNAGLGPLHLINGTMDQIQYHNIMSDVKLPYANINLAADWILQQDNDPKHTTKSVKHWFQTSNVRVLEWLAQSADLNPIENLWNIVK